MSTPERKGRTPHHLSVTRIHRPAPRVVAVTLRGDSLAEFTPPSPGGHIKIAFDTGGDRPTMRTYTPRRFDPDTLELDIEFVLHGDGVAATWAASADTGDQLTVLGPGGRYRPAAPSGVFVIAVDDTAIPAAGTVIEALPHGTEIIALCEVNDGSDERSLSTIGDLDVRWLHRSATQDPPGALLRAAVEDLPAGLDADWFVACEAAAMRGIRNHLRTTRGVDPKRLQTRGYWRQGETDYPDHDYGED
ncbi:siderophore-interacting protein [Actinospongicola halichondriae]|uniref:siderophore-interacting protein n=1 Tax=Actinospongicola halichondriae TaxID=3236844 RepID=UPI003D3DEACD